MMKMYLILFQQRLSRFAPTKGGQCIYRLLLLFVLLAVGCKHISNKEQEKIWRANIGIDAPTNFIEHVVQADHIIVIYRYPDMEPRYKNVRLRISGQRLKEIITAMTLLRNEWTGIHPESGCMCEWRLQFYQRTNLLASADFQEYVIRFDQEEYVDHTGVLEKLYKELNEKISSLNVDGMDK